MPLASLAILYRFPPATTPYYPRCPIHELTGLLCPGCGATRALAALLHAHWLDAWHANALILLALPFAIGYFLKARAESCWAPISKPILATLFVAATIFTVARNLS